MIILLSILLFWIAGYGIALSLIILDEIENQEYLTPEDIKVLKIYGWLSWLYIVIHYLEKWEELKKEKSRKDWKY